MSRQLTSEERKIIERTEREGAELAAEESADGKIVWRRRIWGVVIFAVVFLLFALVSFAVFSAFGDLN